METMFPLYSLFTFIVLHMHMYAANIYFWRRYRVNYSFIFGFKGETALGYREVLLVSFGLAVLALGSVLANIDMEMDPKTGDYKALTELLPAGVVVLVIAIMICPFSIIYRSSRYFLLTCIFHCVCTPLYKNLKYTGNQANGDMLPRVQRYLAELDLDKLHVGDLVQLEKELETVLAQTRAAKIFVNAIWPYSGHYYPTKESFKEFISFLEENHVDLANVKMLEQRCAIDDDYLSSNIEAKESMSSITTSQPGDKNESDVNVPTKKTDVVSVEEPMFRMARHLSCKWTSGAGARISCVRDYPTEFQFQALEQVNLSPKVASGPGYGSLHKFINLLRL